MFPPRTATHAVWPRNSRAAATAFFLLCAGIPVEAQEHEHHHEPQHADTSGAPMTRNSASGHNSTAGQGIAEMDTMPGMRMPARPFGIPMSRMGSGTSWLPDASPMRAYHFMRGSWTLMVHGDVDLYFNHQGTNRGDDQVGSTNWAMLMAMRP